MKKHLHSFMRKRLFVLLLGFTLYNPSHAQHLIFGSENTRVEIGLNFGPTFFLGDLGGHAGYGTKFVKDINLPLTKLMKGAFLSVYPNEWLGFRIAAQYTYVEGKDELINTNGINELYRKQRNLDFKSNMWEAYTAVEYFPLMYLKRNDEEYDPRLRPYVFGGVGVFHFNPMGSLTDQYGNVTWHELHPLHTEGQGFKEYPLAKPYKLTQLNIPFGGGIKYLASEKLSLGLELLYRHTFTDYIDDVSTIYVDPNIFDSYLSAADANIASQIYDKTFGIIRPGATRTAPGLQRGNPRNNDDYFSFVLKCGIQLGSGDGGSYGNSSAGRNARMQMRCPARF